MANTKRVLVKMCGTASVADAKIAEAAGADYLGVVVEVDYSPRNQTPESAWEILRSVGIPGIVLVFEPLIERAVEIARIMEPHGLQLLGRETPEYLAELRARTGLPMWKSIHVPPGSGGEVDADAVVSLMKAYVDAGAEALLLDTAVVEGTRTRFGGTGRTSNWEIAREIMARVEAPVWLAGGLSPENAGEAVRFVQPYGLDLCSGLESGPGKRDEDKVRRFMAAVRR